MNKKFDKKVNYLIMIYVFQVLLIIFIPLLLFYLYFSLKDSESVSIEIGYIPLFIVTPIMILIIYGRIIAIKKCVWIKKSYRTNPSTVIEMIKDRLSTYNRIKKTQRKYYDYRGMMRGLVTYRLFSDLLLILEKNRGRKKHKKK